MKKNYDFIEHTADIAVRAYGRDLQEAFASAAEAMFDIITGHASIRKKEEITFEIESIDQEGLLVNFLSYLVTLHDTEFLVLKDFNVIFRGCNRLQAKARGERFEIDRHGNGTQIKGVSYHMLELEEGNGRNDLSFVQVLFDI
jgi:SHS2 domain-containing protein